MSASPVDLSSPETQARRLRLLAHAQTSLQQLSQVLQPLADRFHAQGYNLYLVGGSVRDAVLGRLGNDLDFTTEAHPDVILPILRDYTDTVWDTGIEFGTVSAEHGGQQIEITTFRTDSYDGKTRNPQVQFGDDLRTDLSRRDFSINAMAVQLGPAGAMEFVDPLGGMDGILQGLIDTPDAPEISFHDDPLRMLRAARFVSQLGFDLAPRVEQAMRDMQEELDRITVERIRAEFDKLLCGNYPLEGINTLVETGLAQRFIPEVPGMQLARDEHMQHKDVYWHSLTVLRNTLEYEESDPDLVLRLAALLHDIGKPATRALKPGGGVTFHHHEVVGAKMARKRMKALKYSKQMVEDVSTLVFLHLRFHGYSDGQWTDSAVRRYVTDAGELLPRLHKLVRSDCTTRNKRKAAMLQRRYDGLEQRIEELAAQEDLNSVRPDLDGNAIMEILGLPPGPVVGQAWKYLKNVRLDHGPLEYDEAVKHLHIWWDDYNRDQENSVS